MGSLTDFKKRHGIPVYEKEEATASSGTEKANSLTKFLKRHGAIDYQERARQKQKDMVDRINAQSAPFLKTPQTAAEKSFDAIGKALGNANWAQQKAVHEQRMALIAEGQKAREEAEGLTAQIQEAKKQAGKDRQSFYGPATTYGGQGQVTPQKEPAHLGQRAPEIYKGSEADKTVEELEARQRELKLKYWSSLFLDPEFEGKSAYVPETDDWTYRLVNGDPGVVRNQDRLDQRLSFVGLDKRYLKQLKADEISLYNYVYATQGRDAATDFMDAMRPVLYARQRGSEEEDARKTAEDYPVLSSAYTMVTPPLKGVGFVGQTADFLADGKIDQNAPWNRHSYTNSAIRGQVGESFGDVGNFLYQTGMSIGDFISSFTVGGPTGSLYLMSTGASADMVVDAKDRGLDDHQAYALGTIAGAAEFVMEKIGMDALFDTKFLRSKGWRGYLLMNGLAESFEEVGTDGINTLADIIISQDKSLWQEAIDKYREAGMTESQAFGKAVGDKALELFLSAAGGFISGEALGSVGAIKYNMELADMGRKIDAMGLSSQQIRGLVRQGLDLPQDSRAFNLAMGILDDLNAGKTVKGRQIAEMIVAGQEHLDAQAEDAELPEGDGQNEGGVAVPPSAEGDTPTVNNADSPLREGAEDTEEVGGDRHVADAPREDTVSGDRHVDDAPHEDTVSWDRRVDDVTGEGSVSARDINDRIGEDRNDDGPAWVSLPVVEQEGAYDGEGTGPQFTEGGRSAGAGVSDGGSQWDAGSGAGEQTGRVGSGPAWRGTQDPGGRKAEVARQSRFSDLRLPRVSSLKLGLQSGTEARVTREVTDEYWDDEMQDLAVRIYEETGKEVRFVLGPIQIRNKDGVVRNVRGVYTGEQIIVQADNYRAPMERLADHEAFHAKNDLSGGRLLDEVRQHIMERFTEEEYRQVVDRYIDALYGVYDLTEDMDGEALEEAMKLIEEEVFADAYAGINAFGAGADRFGEAVNERMDQLWMGKKRAQDNGTAEPTGPPVERFSIGEIDGVKRVKERFSYAGEQAQTADLDALERAKEMQAAGVAEETIRQETGWFVGMDGKWRWEIDDRESASRRMLTSEGRKVQAPDLGDPGTTVFVEDSDGRSKRLSYSVDDTDSEGRSLSAEQQNYFKDSVVRDREGRLLVVYHQTDADFTIFETRRPGAGSNDNETPFGIFLKRSSEDIGLAGKKQMALYANITNPLRVSNRAELVRQLRHLSRDYAEISDRFLDMNREYQSRIDDAKKAWSDYVAKWRAEHPNAGRRDIYDDPKFNELDDVEDDLIDEWTAADARLCEQAKHTITEALRRAGYDGIMLANDAGSWGRRTDAIIALDPDQVKNVDNRKPTKHPDIRYSVDDGVTEQGKEKKPEKKEKPKPVAESRPIRAKRELRQTLMGLFSIPEGSRVELWEMIDSYADRLIKNGGITEEDRRTFFDRMYEAGVMVAPADDYFAEARNYIEGGKIYVPDSVVAELGDDWADIRRRAFCAGVYLTRSDMSKGHKVSGIDGWNTDLSMELPGLFDSEDTDLKSILERIVQVAEEGKAERLSLPEYTKRLAEQGEVSEDEFLDHMERQMDWALRTFAEKAELEVYLRDRTGVKIAQERERYDARTAARKAQESQRRAKERQERKDMAQRAKDRRELAELQKKTLKQLQWLAKNRNRAPEDLRAVWDEVLGDIDLYAVGAANEMLWSDRYNATWRDIAQMYKDAKENDPNFMPSKDLERIIARLDGKKIGEMDLGALQDLYRAAIGLRTEYYNRRNVINDDMHRLFSEVYTDSKHEIESADGGYSGKGLDKLFNLEQLTPMNVLERMGGWDPDGAFYSMAKQLEQGERDQRAYTVKAQKMLQQFLEEHEDFVKKADGQGEDAVWYEVKAPELLELNMGDKPIFGDTVTVYMTPAQKIHMYLESKNVDNLRHMTGGRTFVDKELYSQGKRQEALAQGRTIRLAPETVRALVSDLTAEEMELATLLERYYNGFATGEINRVSNALYGYDKAMGDHYAPIYTNQNYTNSEFGVFDVTAEGVGNLKERKHAKNPSYNISCFDAFERHVDRTARFVGMAIPTRNWQQLMNWRTHDNSTADVIAHKWGDESVKYIDDLITRLQGGTAGESDAVSSWVGKLQSNYISAVFGANPSIVLKQLGSIPLAGAYLGAGNIPRLRQLRNIDRELIGKYTQELEWRTMGYTTPETKFLKDNPNWTQTNKFVRFVFGGGAITAMDGWAASTLWPWAENKVRKEQPELEIGTQEQIDRGESQFYRKVAEEFNNAVSRSQSVSDEIHQGSLRKSKNPLTRAFTLFRSDSAQSYNALRQLIGEARYQKKNGSDDKAAKVATAAVGTAFMAIMVNAMWGEAINFLMALWKNKGKKYRDDEEELTTGSVISEMVSGMMGSMAGVVTGGEELFELIGNILTGDKWYGIDTPGMEQLNDLTDAIVESGKDIRELVSGGWDVFNNGGDLGAYFTDSSETILDTIKSMASTVAQYLGGVPANNIEAYLVGTLKWLSPELGAAYDDLFDEVDRADLAKTEDGAVPSRVSRILDELGVDHTQEVADALATLYAEGHTTAVPGRTPTSISVNGVDRKLGAYQQQTYGTVWSGVVSEALDELVTSQKYAEADSKTRKKMLESLYAYAKEQAKDVLFDDYELDGSSQKNAEIVAAGASVADVIAWNVITSDMKGWEKAKELISWDLPGIAKRTIFRNKISETREEVIGALVQERLSFDRFLSAYSTYGRINAEEISAGEKATSFAHWLDTQGFTEGQTNLLKDELAFYMMAPAGADRYDKFVNAGLEADEALGLGSVIGDLKPEDGKTSVANIQKWRACIDYFDDKDDQMTALFAVMTESQYQKVEVADEFGVTPDTYVRLQEVLPDYDADGNGAYKQAEIQNAIEALGGQYSAEQKAVLWQLATGSKSSKKNPYSQAVGQQVIDAREAKKSQSDSDEGSFSDAVMGQLIG